MIRDPVALMPRALRFLLCILTAACTGCASYASHSVKIRSELADGKFDKALEEVEKSETGSSHLLALYESGLIYHYARQYEKSNLKLHEAEALYEDLYTKSVSREAGALITSDVIIDYRGERFESAYIHYYKILNYLHLGDGPGALVECRKLNHKLKVFGEAGGSFYTDDPFLEYLTGLVYESQGELQDAWVSYGASLDAYDQGMEAFGVPAPPELHCELERVALRLGYRDDSPETAERTPCPEPASTPGSGEAVLLLETGFVPQKVPIELFAPIFEGDLDKDDFDNDKYSWTLADRAQRNRVSHVEVVHWLKIAFPEMIARPPLVHEVEVVAVQAPTSASTAAEVADLDAVALRRFDETRTRMLAKTLARALAKYLAQEKVEKKKGELAGLAVNIFNVATETADTRSWSTLPGRIYLARLPLAEGTYTLQVVLRDEHGERLGTIPIRDVQITAGRTTFLDHRVF